MKVKEFFVLFCKLSVYLKLFQNKLFFKTKEKEQNVAL